MDVEKYVEALSAADDDTVLTVMTTLLRSRPEIAPSIVSTACPDLTFAPVKALSERRNRGTIKSFDPQSGIGSIDCAELKGIFGVDVKLHGDQLGLFKPGIEVTFSVTLTSENKPQAGLPFRSFFYFFFQHIFGGIFKRVFGGYWGVLGKHSDVFW